MGDATDAALDVAVQVAPAGDDAADVAGTPSSKGGQGEPAAPNGGQRGSSPAVGASASTAAAGAVARVAPGNGDTLAAASGDVSRPTTEPDPSSLQERRVGSATAVAGGSGDDGGASDGDGTTASANSSHGGGSGSDVDPSYSSPPALVSPVARATSLSSGARMPSPLRRDSQDPSSPAASPPAFGRASSADMAAAAGASDKVPAKPRGEIVRFYMQDLSS